MDWHIHALYALAIVVLLFLLAVADKTRRKAMSWIEHDAEDNDRLRSVIQYEQDCRAKETARLRRDLNRAYEGIEKRDKALQSCEQSRRAYKGHNKRYRERIAELEGEQ